MLSMLLLTFPPGDGSTPTPLTRSPLGEDDLSVPLLRRFVATMLTRRGSPDVQPRQVLTSLGQIASRWRGGETAFSFDLVDVSWVGQRSRWFRPFEWLSRDNPRPRRLARSTCIALGAMVLGCLGYLLLGWEGAAVGIVLGMAFRLPESIQVDTTSFRRSEPGLWDLLAMSLAGLFTGIEWPFGLRVLFRLIDGLRTLVPIRTWWLPGLGWMAERRAERRALGPSPGPIIFLACGCGAALGWAEGPSAIVGYGLALNVAMLTTLTFGNDHYSLLLNTRFLRSRFRQRELPSPSVCGLVAGGLVWAPLVGIVTGTWSGLALSLTDAAAQPSSFGLAAGLAAATYWMACLAVYLVVEQVSVRRELGRRGILPLPAGPLLEHSANCGFLHRVDDGYTFIHDWLQDYFAQLDQSNERALIEPLLSHVASPER